MHPSQVPADWQRAAEGFAHAWRVVRVTVISDRPGSTELRELVSHFRV
jgi:S-DNA-T family DNA segregation ATPase FtsK/SpoIIIE